MLEEITKELQNLEKEKNIKILYAVESGSRAWGFASQNSDWDVRFIYVHNYDWYLSIYDKKDSIERILDNDIDLGGWELRKSLQLFKKSNPPLLEWLRSPIVYKENFSTVNELRSLSEKFFNPKSCLYHYFHMANGNFKAYFKEDTVRLKKYFYVLRPILACCWIEKRNEMAPMEFEILLNEEIYDSDLKKEINKLLLKKKSGDELNTGDRIKIIDNFIQEKITHFEVFLDNYDFKLNGSTEILNNLFRNTLKEVWTN